MEDSYADLLDSLEGTKEIFEKVKKMSSSQSSGID